MPECTKVKFLSEEYANFHINKHAKKNELQGLKARAYQCRFCSAWHITSKTHNNELIIDNEALRTQLIDQIKNNVDLQAEIEILKEHLKVKTKQFANNDPMYKQLKEQVNKQQRKIKDQRDTINQLLGKLSKFL